MRQTIAMVALCAVLLGATGCATGTYSPPDPVAIQSDFSFSATRDLDTTWAVLQQLLNNRSYVIRDARKADGVIEFFFVAPVRYAEIIDCGYMVADKAKVIRYDSPYIDFLSQQHNANLTALGRVFIESTAPLVTEVTIRVNYKITVPNHPNVRFEVESGAQSEVNLAQTVTGSGSARACQPTHKLEREFIERVAAGIQLTQPPGLLQVAEATPQSILGLEPVPAADWIGLLSSRPTWPLSELVELAQNLSDETSATNWLDASENTLMIALSSQLKACVLQRYVHERTMKDDSIKRKSTQCQGSLESAGISKAAIEESVRNLAVATGFAARQQEINRLARGEEVISVIGIVPGLSTKADIQYTLKGGGHIIGGYKLACTETFGQDGTLDALMCIFGESVGTRDIAANQREFVSNDIVYFQLRKGFSNKYGQPATQVVELRPAIGAPIQTETATWVDRKGNQLVIRQTDVRIGTGSLFLESASKLRTDRIEQERADQRREF